MEQKFNIGDVVKLKSGDVKMTIRYIDMGWSGRAFAGFYKCTWIETAGKLHQQQFHQDMLVLDSTPTE